MVLWKDLAFSMRISRAASGPLAVMTGRLNIRRRLRSRSVWAMRWKSASRSLRKAPAWPVKVAPETRGMALSSWGMAAEGRGDAHAEQGLSRARRLSRYAPVSKEDCHDQKTRLCGEAMGKDPGRHRASRARSGDDAELRRQRQRRRLLARRQDRLRERRGLPRRRERRAGVLLLHGDRSRLRQGHRLRGGA